jgi:hypothetical protein
VVRPTSIRAWNQPAGSGTGAIGGRFVVEAGDAPNGAWIGALDLAPVALDVTP